jgi:transcriptional regulator with XRE-family HTH domain/quercetin dioxygenase-like cupin family protein
LAGISGLGEKIRKIRTAKGRTLANVASEVDCSVALLSQIETGKVTPSVKTLVAIATALKVPVGILFEDVYGSDNIWLASAKERPAYQQVDEGCSASYLGNSCPGADHEADVFEVVMQPGGSTGSAPLLHPGREMGVILEGEVILTLEDEEYTLTAGDLVCFRSELGHRIRNESDKPAKGLWFVMPPGEKGKRYLVAPLKPEQD